MLGRRNVFAMGIKNWTDTLDLHWNATSFFREENGIRIFTLWCNLALRSEGEITLNMLLWTKYCNVLLLYNIMRYLWRWPLEAIPESGIVKWSLISHKTINSLLFSLHNFTKRKYSNKNTYGDMAETYVLPHL